MDELSGLHLDTHFANKLTYLPVGRTVFLGGTTEETLEFNSLCYLKLSESPCHLWDKVVPSYLLPKDQKSSDLASAYCSASPATVPHLDFQAAAGGSRQFPK